MTIPFGDPVIEPYELQIKFTDGQTEIVEAGYHVSTNGVLKVFVGYKKGPMGMQIGWQEISAWPLANVRGWSRTWLQ